LRGVVDGFTLACYLYIAPKKPTRQWAAWTRQEEESFFTALRQVGKVYLYVIITFDVFISFGTINLLIAISLNVEF
jgi:hypothetical protein